MDFDDDIKYDLMAEINMVPLVDVVFVLLIIFMATAPLMQKGIDVDLPVAKSNTITQEERVNIAIDKKGNIFVNEELVSKNQLFAVLDTLKIKTPDILVYLKSDQSVNYGTVVMVMDIIKQVGIEKLGMVTQTLPPGEQE